MVNAGRILILTKGEWSNLTNYEQLDLVSKNGVAYLARQASVGVNPSTDTSMTYWQPFGSVSDIATTTTPGLVMPDGDTIQIGTGGLIYVDMDAGDVDYDNTTSGISATTVQAAIDTAVANAKLALDGIATVEATSTASKAYALGDLFFYNGKLYVCTLAFAQGAMIIPGTNCSETTISAQIGSLNSAIQNKADSSKAYQTDDTAETAIDDADYVPFYDTSATAKRKSLWSNIKSVLKTYFDTLYATLTTVNNKHKVSTFEVTTSSWSQDTTSQSGSTLYKKSVALSHVYVENPSVEIGTASGSVLPTTAQQTAYDLLKYVTVDGTTLYLYASDIPTDAFYINIEGVD